jgi:hypothetical protein
MRAIRAVAVAALVALDVSAAAAQPGRHFKDSWFWGVKGGILAYRVQSDPQPDNPIEQFFGQSVAPLGGIDWLITRTNGGLYVSYDRSFFSQFMFVNDSASPAQFTPCASDPTITCGRQVAIKDMDRATLAGVLFPMQTYRLHPYFGFGATLLRISSTDPGQGAFASSTQRNLVFNTVQSGKAVASPLIIVGAQLRLLKFSAFGQVTTSPVNRGFLLFEGSWRSAFEAGLRFNTGTSIDRMK